MDVLQVAARRPLRRSTASTSRSSRSGARSSSTSRSRSRAGRPVLVELDSFYLPDTAGTAYRRAHVKIDGRRERDRRRAPAHRLLPQPGYYELQGDDFGDVFRLAGLAHERMLPPYVEFVKRRRDFAAAARRRARRGARSACCGASSRACRASNPFERFSERFAADLDWLMASRHRALPRVLVRDAAAVRRVLRARRDLPALARRATASRAPSAPPTTSRRSPRPPRRCSSSSRARWRARSRSTSRRSTTMGSALGRKAWERCASARSER